MNAVLFIYNVYIHNMYLTYNIATNDSSETYSFSLIHRQHLSFCVIYTVLNWTSIQSIISAAAAAAAAAGKDN